MIWLSILIPIVKLPFTSERNHLFIYISIYYDLHGPPYWLDGIFVVNVLPSGHVNDTNC